MNVIEVDSLRLDGRVENLEQHRDQFRRWQGLPTVNSIGHIDDVLRVGVVALADRFPL